MTSSRASAFLPMAFSGPAWTAAPDVMSMPVQDDRSLVALVAERELHDFAISYAHTLDKGNVDDIMQFFATDCVMTSPRGTFTGGDELRTEYERMVRDASPRMHQFSNVFIRLAGDLASGYVSCNVTAILDGAAGTSRLIAGYIVIHAVRTSDGWRIRRRWVANDVEASLDTTSR